MRLLEESHLRPNMLSGIVEEVHLPSMSRFEVHRTSLLASVTQNDFAPPMVF